MTDTSWQMLIETAEQQKIFMAFPPRGTLFGESDAEVNIPRAAWAEVANKTADFIPVEIIVDPADADSARSMLSKEIEIHLAPLNEAWMRDFGPTFVHDGKGNLGAIDWTFNGWGQQSAYHHDQQIAALVCEIAGVERISSQLVNEGGGIHVDGKGTVFLTDTVQLDRYRNPCWSRREIEAELTRTIGATSFVWFRNSLYRDAMEGGTRGHVDIIAAPSDTETVLLHKQECPEHPDFHLYETHYEDLRRSKSTTGNDWRILNLPAPKQLRDDRSWTDYSYVNHLVTNGAVIACMFDDPNDAIAREVLAEAYPGREIVGVDARNIFRYGGGIHCITQQMPRI
ncbi:MULTISPECIES: agmatine deiminase family protein [unclassified Mycolicibacterium]|uniref:agmatine deiminase family protein n=1 Tax=unclassified Mycolicibacterium TaxID=2636767 RepID=UPI002ED9B401